MKNKTHQRSRLFQETSGLHALRNRTSEDPSIEAVRKEVVNLRLEIEQLKRERSDLEMSLMTSNEHGDMLEDHLYRTNTSLTAEVRERQLVEDKLQRLLQAISKEKCDLEILVQILVDQGDASAAEGEEARVDGLTQIANRRRFDEYLAQEWSRHCRSHQPLSASNR